MCDCLGKLKGRSHFFIVLAVDHVPAVNDPFVPTLAAVCRSGSLSFERQLLNVPAMRPYYSTTIVYVREGDGGEMSGKTKTD
jgi:hypothetical protein